MIDDGAHDGNEHFYFLPPMVGAPSATGTFDGSQSPVVEICRVDAGACVETLLTFTTTTGPGSETVRVSAEDEHYILNWHTDVVELDEDTTYRVVVSVEGAVIGFADVDVVGRARELRSVDTDEYIALVDGRTLPIKFRLEEGFEPEPATGGGMDLNGDGVPDFIGRGGPEYGLALPYLSTGSGPSTEPSTTVTAPGGPHFFSAGAYAGDVNGDGYGDVVLGARYLDGTYGRAFLYRGAPGGLELAPAAEWLNPLATGSGTAGGIFGADIEAIDVTGDGRCDMVVASSGYVHVYEGVPGGFSAAPLQSCFRPGAASPDRHFATNIAAAGDTNGDGFGDLVVRASAPESGYVLYGSPTGFTASATVIPPPPGVTSFLQTYGQPIAGGDVNGDGYADVVLGAHNDSTYDGAVYVFAGSASGVSTTATWVLTTPAGSQGRTGLSVQVVGDYTGDGIADVVAMGDGWFGSLPRAYLYAGGATGPSLLPLVTFELAEHVPYQIISVVPLGDVDVDGRDDLLFGVPSADPLDPAFVRYAVFFGGPTGLRTTPDVGITNPSDPSVEGLSHSAIVGANPYADGTL